MKYLWFVDYEKIFYDFFDRCVIFVNSELFVCGGIDNDLFFGSVELFEEFVLSIGLCCMMKDCIEDLLCLYVYLIDKLMFFFFNKRSYVMFVCFNVMKLLVFMLVLMFIFLMSMIVFV